MWNCVESVEEGVELFHILLGRKSKIDVVQFKFVVECLTVDA